MNETTTEPTLDAETRAKNKAAFDRIVARQNVKKEQRIVTATLLLEFENKMNALLESGWKISYIKSWYGSESSGSTMQTQSRIVERHRAILERQKDDVGVVPRLDTPEKLTDGEWARP